ncbi:MAG TPA: hypothetical protein PKV72_05530 [Candidatus Peribacteria bacterium]|nr:hypothetical protein [Candidatus Peribacteria bacterium]
MSSLLPSSRKEDRPYVSPPYSVAEAGGLLFTVNRLSQGGTDGVHLLLTHALTRLDWKPEMIVVGDVIDGVRDRVLRFVGNRALHEHIDMGSVDEQLESQAEKLKLYAGADGADGEAQLPGITQYVLRMDKEWLLKPEGRPRRAAAGPPASDFHDPWLSHLCHFGINGHTTRHPLFDRMFGEIRARLLGTAGSRNRLLGCDDPGDLEAVIALHNKHHPHERVELPA